MPVEHLAMVAEAERHRIKFDELDVLLKEIGGNGTNAARKGMWNEYCLRKIGSWKI